MADIISALKSVKANSFANDGERKEAINQAYALLSRIETGWDTSIRLALTIPTQMAALKIAIDLNLFQNWLNKNQGAKLSIDELSSLVECDPELFGRIVRHLGATHMLWVDETSHFEMTPFAISCVKEDMVVAVNYFFLSGMPPALNLPTFFNDIQYQHPDGKDKDNFKHWKNQTVWEWLESNPKAAMNLGQWMKSTSSKRGNFGQVYPCDTLEGIEGETLVVDIGGSLGHDLHTFKALYPNKKGKLVLQDLPSVIENAKSSSSDPSIEMQTYDFFTPQPIIGAKIYLLHTVLHDWADADAKRILETVRPALKSGHSKLLIHEVVVPDICPDVESTTRDLTMMTLASGIERTEKQWSALITSAGFKITKIWHNPLFTERVIETEVA